MRNQSRKEKVRPGPVVVGAQELPPSAPTVISFSIFVVVHSSPPWGSAE